LGSRRPPRLVLVRQPDQLGLQGAHPPLTFVVEHRHVAADDDSRTAGFNDDHLRTWRVAGRRDEPEPRQHLQLAVDGYVTRSGRIDPLADRVVVPAARVVKLPALDVDRPAGEQVVAAAVIEVQVRVDDDVDSGQIEISLLGPWNQRSEDLPPPPEYVKSSETG